MYLTNYTKNRLDTLEELYKSYIYKLEQCDGKAEEIEKYYKQLADNTKNDKALKESYEKLERQARDLVDEYKKKLKALYDEKSKTFVFDVGNNNLTFYFGTLDLSNFNIEIKGSGSVNIIVDKKVKLERKIKRTDNNPQKLNIYYQGTEVFESNDNTFICSSLHIWESKVDFKGAEIIGNVYYHGTTLLEVHYNSYNYASAIIAPKAKVQTHGNAKFTGVILAKELEINGNHELRPSDAMLVPVVPYPNPNPSTSITIDDRPKISESDVEEK